jgi:hypothetical protein
MQSGAHIHKNASTLLRIISMRREINFAGILPFP